MSTLNTKSNDAIVALAAAGMQGRVSSFLNFAIGSVLRAIAEAFSGVVLWLQAQNLAIAKLTRLSTSYGADADTFLADYGIITRIGAAASAGLVTFSRYTAAPSAPVVPVGAQVKTGDGSQVFQVYADPTNTAYSASYTPPGATVPTGGYVMPAAVATLSCPVQAVVPGAAGNVAAGAISLISSAVSGIDTVTNPAGFTNGFDEEADGPLKARFRAAIAGLARGDFYGTAYALGATNITVQWTLTETQNLDGSWHPGFYYIVADDGSGAPPPAFMAAIATAANSVRPLGTQCAVFPPTLTAATASLVIATAAGYDHPTVVAQVGAAVAAGINGLGLGNGLPFSQVAAWAYGVPGVVSVTGVTLNGGTADIAASPKQTIKVASILVS